MTGSVGINFHCKMEDRPNATLQLMPMGKAHAVPHLDSAETEADTACVVHAQTSGLLLKVLMTIFSNVSVIGYRDRLKSMLQVA